MHEPDETGNDGILLFNLKGLSNVNIYVDDDFESLLKLFYDRLFPFKLMTEWLGTLSILNQTDHGVNVSLSQREISLQLKNEIVVRFLSFDSPEEWQAKCVRQLPHKIDIGAVYSVRPCEKKSVSPSSFRPVEKEFVIDIDLTDYDDVRTCCNAAKICSKCWKFVTISVQIIDAALREDFGFKHRLWVYSGRRGAHCWVSDVRAREMSTATRKAVITYLELLKGGSEMKKRVQLDSFGCIHPSITRAMVILNKWFDQVFIEDQDLLNNEERCSQFLQLIPHDDLREQLRLQWSKNSHNSTMHRYRDFHSLVSKYSPPKNARFNPLTLQCEVISQYLYPRLDVNVSIQLNHLLKSPFCVHPKTGRVCVPFQASDAEKFDPLSVPTISQLCHELNVFDTNPSNDSSVPDFQKTSLEPYIAFFAKTIASHRSDIISLRKRNRSQPGSLTTDVTF